MYVKELKKLNAMKVTFIRFNKYKIKLLKYLSVSIACFGCSDYLKMTTVWSLQQGVGHCE